MGLAWIMTAVLYAAGNPFSVPWIQREYGKTFWGDVRDMCGGWPVENLKALDLIDTFVRPERIFGTGRLLPGGVRGEMLIHHLRFHGQTELLVGFRSVFVCGPGINKNMLWGG